MYSVPGHLLMTDDFPNARRRLVASALRGGYCGGGTARSGASAPVTGGAAEGVAEDAAEVRCVEETPAGSYSTY